MKDLTREEINKNKDKNKSQEIIENNVVNINTDKANKIVEETVFVEVVEEICETNNDSNVVIVQTKVRET